MDSRSAELPVAPHNNVPNECADEATLEQLNQMDWPLLSRQLALYASKRATLLYWGREGHPGRLPKGYQARELVTEAIMRLYRGTRRWDPDQDPDLLDYLRGVVDSLLSSLVRSRDHRVSKERVDVDEVDLPDDGRPTPEDNLLHAERLEIENRVLDGLLTLTKKDPLVADLLDHLYAGEGRPRVIAEKLHCEVNDIYNARKRLDRMLKELKTQFAANELQGGAP